MKAYEEIMKALSFYFTDEPTEQMSEDSIYEIIGQEHDPIETIANALDDYRESGVSHE